MIDESDLKFDCTGVRLLMKDGKIEDHDPVEHDNWSIGSGIVLIGNKYEYQIDDVEKILNYNLFKEKDCNRFIRKDLDGKVLHG